MKFLILFELGKKRFVQAFLTHNAAVDAINSYTQLADDVILSIAEIEPEKYEVMFEDGSRACFKIVKSKNDSILGYYPADLSRIFAKLRSILLSKREQADKNTDRIIKTRLEAFAMILCGIGIILGGFAVAAVAFAPNGESWQFAAMGSLIALGLATTFRGSYVLVHPIPKPVKLVKQTA
jgi:hypothetical protein